MLVVLDVLARLLCNSPLYLMAVPAIPALFRYSPNVHVEETIAGDLGDGRDVEELEPRLVKTTIDEFGFRNDEGASGRLVDLIVLGDSFGFGFGTTQEKILASRIRDRFGLSTYNLSMPWTGPWAQFVNLSVESGRLKLRDGATVVWLLFSGNDLDDTYGELNVGQIPRNGLVGRLWISLKRIRNRSPIYRRLLRVGANLAGPPPVSVVTSSRFVNGRAFLTLDPYTEASRRSYEDVVAHPNFEPLRRTVAATEQLTSRLKISLKIVLAPTKEEVYAWVLHNDRPWSTSPERSGLSKALGEICKNIGIEFLDLKPFFVTSSKELFEQSGRLLWWYDDSHWNEEGQELAASIIYRELLAHERPPATVAH